MRLACNSEKIFHVVVEQVKNDVDQMNSAGLSAHFDVLEEGNTVTIVPQGYDADSRGIVRFKCNSHSIHVKNDSKHVDDFLIKWSWNQDTATCDLSVNGATMLLWEVSQKALYPIFFPDEIEVRAPIS